MQARERDLGRSREVKAVGRELVDVRLVGGEGTGADERRLAHEHWREHGDEAFRCEAIERESVEREREPSGVSHPVPEPRAGHPRRALHVEPAHLDVLAGSVSSGGVPTRRTSRTSSSVEPSGTSS